MLMMIERGLANEGLLALVEAGSSVLTQLAAQVWTVGQTEVLTAVMVARRAIEKFSDQAMADQ